MLRVSVESLLKKDGVFFYREEVFTGVVFSLKGCEIESAVKVRGGIPQGEYSNEYLPELNGAQKVESDCLVSENEAEEGPLCYEGQRFSGVAYDFDDYFCTGELHYIRGWLESQVGYYKSGVLSLVELVEEGFSQKFHWYENGQIKRYEIYERDLFDISLSFEEMGSVNTISIDGNYFDRLRVIAEKIKFHIFFNKKFTSELSGASYLYLSGSMVDEELFKNLLANNGLSKTKKLRIRRTSLTAISLEKLIPIKNIVELYVESEVLSRDDLKSFKIKRPECFVEFNRSEVVV